MAPGIGTPMAAFDVDVVVLGGGCAGLSLGIALANASPPSACPLKVAILEARPAYTHDRTWCFWTTEVTDLQAIGGLVSHAWHFLRVGAADANAVLLDYQSRPYVMVNSLQFYHHALTTLAGTPHINVRLDQRVTRCEPVGDAWHVHTPTETLRCKAVVDTRPLALPVQGGALLWQSFYGMEIECEQAVFSADCADLMDFARPSDKRITFTYVLPTSAHRALIELTVFSPQPLGPELLGAQLDVVVARLTRGAKFTCLRTEHGVLPMGAVAPLPPARRNYIYAGLTAGGARAATGYAFVRIQRWALACAQALARGQAPIGHAPDSWLQSRMDTLFLHVIRAHPELAPALFLALFRRAGAARMARFLSDQASPLDVAAIVAALPPTPFLRQLLRNAWA